MVNTEYLLIGSRHNVHTLAEHPCLFIGDELVKRILVTNALTHFSIFLCSALARSYPNIVIAMSPIT